MDIISMRVAALGITGAMLAGVSAWLHVKTEGKSGFGWGFIAFCFLMSCLSQAK